MRKPRLEFKGALFHVLARGNQRQNVFWDDGDRVRYLNLLAERLEVRRFRLYAYCLMGNHVHLLLEQGGVYPLSKYMQRLQSAYTAFFNHKHGKIGHLFQGRYKAILVDREPYLLELVRYIHLNPHRSGLPKAESYPWTSHRQYLGQDRYPLAPVKSAGVLSRFANKVSTARVKYLEFMETGSPKALPNPFAELRGGRILGDEDFEAEVGAKSGVSTSPSLKMRLDLGGIWKALLRREGLAQEPTGWRRSRLMAEAAWIAVEGAQMRQKSVAEFFKVEPAGLSQAVQRMEARWRKGVGSRESLDRWARGLNC